MRAAFVRGGFLVLIALLGIALAPTAVAGDIARFDVTHNVHVGDATLVPGTYVFYFPNSGTYPGVVLVYDQGRARLLALASVNREAVEATEYDAVGELTYDASIRSIRHEFWRYTFRPAKLPVATAALPVVTAMEVVSAP